MAVAGASLLPTLRQGDTADNISPWHHQIFPDGEGLGRLLI
jgi:hypothetical protein